jgi:integrase
MSLTVKKVTKLLRRGEPGRTLDGGASGVRGLYLCVDSGTAASWALRYQVGGRAHWMGIGSARTFSLDEARQRAKAHRQRLADGHDPLHLKRSERAANLAAAVQSKTFKQCAEELILERGNEWKSARHGQDWRSTLARFAFPIIGNMDTAQIDRAAVLRVLEQQVPTTRGHPPGKFWLCRTITADRVRNRIELVLNYAAARGHRPEGENPAAWGVLQHVLGRPSKVAPKVHLAALPYAELPALMGELKQHAGVSVRALQFAILTATRSNEVLGAQWSEIDLDNKLWTIPASRMKSGREHRVPLADAALELLNSAYREADNPSVWIGTTQPRLSGNALLRALAAVRTGLTVHGFRSSFSDFAHERTAHSNHVIELSLAHSIGNQAERAYSRTDLFNKRRQLMDAWAKFAVMPLAKQKAGGEVMSILRGVRS